MSDPSFILTDTRAILQLSARIKQIRSDKFAARFEPEMFFLLLTDETGTYPPEAEVWEITDACRVKIYRFALERMKWHAEDDEDGVHRQYLIHHYYGPDCSYGPALYRPWWIDKLAQALDFANEAAYAFEFNVCSPDPETLLEAYELLVEYFGPFEFDQYPLDLTFEEGQARIRKHLRAYEAAKAEPKESP